MSTIINVGRSFGSGGGFVGQAIGKKLGIPVFDNELISKAAEESGYSKSLFAKGEEKSLVSVSSFFASGRLSYLDNGYVNDNVLFNIQSEVIRNIADKGSYSKFIALALPVASSFKAAAVSALCKRPFKMPFSIKVVLQARFPSSSKGV